MTARLLVAAAPAGRGLMLSRLRPSIPSSEAIPSSPMPTSRAALATAYFSRQKTLTRFVSVVLLHDKQCLTMGPACQARPGVEEAAIYARMRRSVTIEDHPWRLRTGTASTLCCQGGERGGRGDIPGTCPILKLPPRAADRRGVGDTEPSSTRPTCRRRATRPACGGWGSTPPATRSSPPGRWSSAREGAFGGAKTERGTSTRRSHHGDRTEP